MRRTVLGLITFLLLTASCVGNKSIFDQNGNLAKLGDPVKIEYFEHVSGGAFTYEDALSFVITDQQEVKTALNEIRNASNPEPWKGAGWNKIKIHYADTIVELNTNNRKIGTSASGSFYDLDKENFITRHLKNP